MLPEHFRFRVLNKTGQAIQNTTDGSNNDVEVTYRRWKFASGALSWVDASEQSQNATSDIADDGTEELAEIDNSSDLALGMVGNFRVKTDGAGSAVDGNVLLLLDVSVDGGTTYASDAADFDPDNDLPVVASVYIPSGTGTFEHSVPFSLSL